MAKICGVIALLMLAGCKCEDSAVDTSAFLAGLDSTQAANKIYAESIIANQEEHTTALAAIKSQVESLGGELLETRRAVGTMEASLSSADLNRKDGDPKTSPPESPAKANTPTGPIKVAMPGTSSSAVKMSWNIDGNWNPTIIETANHLRDDHGVNIDGMTHQQLHDLHASLHNGTTTAAKPAAVKSYPVQIVSQGTYCPNGQCPMPRQVKAKRRR